MRKLAVILLVMIALSGMAQSSKNLQNRPSIKSEAKFQKLNLEEVKQYENGVMRQIADLSLIPIEIRLRHTVLCDGSHN